MVFFFKVILQFKVQQNKITVLKWKRTDLILNTRYRRSESDLILATPEEIWSYCIPTTSDVVQYDWNQDPTNAVINKGRSILHYGTLEHSQRKKKKRYKKVHITLSKNVHKHNTELFEKLTQHQVLSANVRRSTATQFCLLNKFPNLELLQECSGCSWRKLWGGRRV